MDYALETFKWFLDPTSWLGQEGALLRIYEHLQYSLLSVAIGSLIALPIGLYFGHTGRGGLVAINVLNMGRAIPSFGLVMIAFMALGLGLVPILITLVALAIPPMVTNSFVGVRSVSREVREAAQGMGMTGWEVLTKVEIPVATPLVMAGLRTSAVQVVATATIGAYVGYGGLGRFIIDGRASQDVVLVTAGAILVALLSILTEFSLAKLQGVVVPRGISARSADAALAAKMQ
ncbi:MAG: ABC transporter permease, partial [Actinomycetota bacterium]